MLVQSVLNGYRVMEKLAELPETVLYKAVNEQNLHEVVIKMLLPHLAGKRDLIRQLKREAYYETRFNHPHIIKGRGFYRKPVRHHFVMDFFPSRSMRMRLKKIIVEVGEALAYVHERQVVHRDIKPENILVNSTGDAKVIDFALASRYDFISRLFVRRRIQGTRSYMSPEQIRGESLDNRADIYSYGATIFEMVAGHPPFTGANEAEILKRHLTEPVRPLRQFKKNLTAAFDALVTSMLAKKPSQRPSSMAEVVETIREIDLFLDEPDGWPGETGEINVEQ